MKALTKPLSWSDPTFASTNDAVMSGSSPDLQPSIADVVTNAEENPTSRIVKQYYRNILTRHGPRDQNWIARQAKKSGSPTIVTDDTTDTSVDLVEKKHLRAPLFNKPIGNRIAPYHALQEWEGYVTAIKPCSVVADLVDVTGGQEVAAEVVELPMQELDESQKQLLKIGAVFRWTIGYETLPSGQRRRVSQIVFRQLPKWSQADVDKSIKIGTERHSKIQWE